jgi:hypothetical protein
MAGTRLAFALAGLGGFNAHGAGFLQAARDNEMEPDLVTATSGQIVVLAAYLKGAKDLKKGLIDKALEDNPLAQLQIALLGYPGVFEPAVAEAVARILTPPYLGMGIDFFTNRFLPAQLYKPTRTAETIKEWLTHLMKATSASSLTPIIPRPARASFSVIMRHASG